MPINIGAKAPPKDTSAGGKQVASRQKGDPGGAMFHSALKRMSSPKASKATASTRNVARQGLAKVDRVTGPRKIRSRIA